MTEVARVRRARFLSAALVVATLASIWLSAFRLRVSSDLSALFPEDPASSALSQFVRAFGGGDLGVVLFEGHDASSVERAARDAAANLRVSPSIAGVLDHAEIGGALDPTLAWAYAGPRARARLLQIVTPEGMRARLAETRAMLLTPGASELEPLFARDPLRLGAVPWESAHELAAGVTPGRAGAFATDDGTARLVLLTPRGNAFDAGAASAFVRDVESALAPVRAAHRDVRIELTGGHAIAYATQRLLERDLFLSGVLSILLASCIFLILFRRARALVAVLPPLVVGTLWTTALAALVVRSLSAIAVAFTAVVVGVGVDTGVHVYAALLDARRRGLSPAAAAHDARSRAARPTLIAACTAALAFGSLALSGLRAMRELGLLCAAGEVLTSVAILLITPQIGARLECTAPPAHRSPAWVEFFARLTSTRRRAGVAMIASLVPFAVLLFTGLPTSAESVVAIRSPAIAPLATYDEIYRRFGGRPGQWIVLTRDADRDAAAARADAVAEALEPLAEQHVIDGFDALGAYVPAPATQRRRLAARDALDWPALRAMLERTLGEAGFDVRACKSALEAFAAPSHAISPLPSPSYARLAWLVARHLHTQDGQTLAATFVRPSGEPAQDARALAAITAADPRAIVTGYPALERGLRASLAHDFPRVALVAALLVALALRGMLGNARSVGLVFLMLLAELGALALGMRAFAIRWHVYNALVLPVLVGITIDEAVFLLFAGRDAASDVAPERAALLAQGPLVAATALTTAGGFAALLACKFPGLFDLGAVGALGSSAGLLAALVVIPAGMRIMRRR